MGPDDQSYLMPVGKRKKSLTPFFACTYTQHIPSNHFPQLWSSVHTKYPLGLDESTSRITFDRSLQLKKRPNCSSNLLFHPNPGQNAQQHSPWVVLLPITDWPIHTISSNFPPASKDQDAKSHHYIEAAQFSPLAFVLGWVRRVVSYLC